MIASFGTWLLKSKIEVFKKIKTCKLGGSLLGTQDRRMFSSPTHSLKHSRCKCEKRFVLFTFFSFNWTEKFITCKANTVFCLLLAFTRRTDENARGHTLRSVRSSEDCLLWKSDIAFHLTYWIKTNHKRYKGLFNYASVKKKTKMNTHRSSSLEPEGSFYVYLQVVKTINLSYFTAFNKSVKYGCHVCERDNKRNCMNINIEFAFVARNTMQLA